MSRGTPFSAASAVMAVMNSLFILACLHFLSWSTALAPDNKRSGGHPLPHTQNLQTRIASFPSIPHSSGATPQTGVPEATPSNTLVEYSAALSRAHQIGSKAPLVRPIINIQAGR